MFDGLKYWALCKKLYTTLFVLMYSYIHVSGNCEKEARNCMGIQNRVFMHNFEFFHFPQVFM